jgi:hypothetical protein
MSPLRRTPTAAAFWSIEAPGSARKPWTRRASCTLESIWSMVRLFSRGPLE